VPLDPNANLLNLISTLPTLLIKDPF